MKSEIAVLTLAASLAVVGFTGYDVTFTRPLLNHLSQSFYTPFGMLSSQPTCHDRPRGNSQSIDCEAVSKLKNATYRLPKLGKFQLKNGIYKNAAKNQRVVLADQAEKIAIGDLTRNGVADAAVLLTARTGGSSSSVYLAAATNAKSNPRPISSVLLGDRVKVRSVEISSAHIKVDLLTRRPRDLPCCPTQPVTQVYTLGKKGLTRLPKSAVTEKSTQIHPLFQASLRPTKIGCG